MSRVPNGSLLQLARIRASIKDVRTDLIDYLSKKSKKEALWSALLHPLLPPYEGKFWVYEQAIRVPFYGIYEVARASVEVYHLLNGRYSLLPTNERGHYPIPPLGVELGIWQGRYNNVELPWLRWWDSEGNLLLTGEERAERERQRAEQERQRAEAAEQEVVRLRERLRQADLSDAEGE